MSSFKLVLNYNQHRVTSLTKVWLSRKPLLSDILFVAVFLGYNQYWLGGFVVLCPGAPEGSQAVVLILKCFRRRGHSLKSHPTGWEMPGIEPVTPGLQDIGLYPTPQRLLM